MKSCKKMGPVGIISIALAGAIAGYLFRNMQVVNAATSGIGLYYYGTQPYKYGLKGYHAIRPMQRYL